MIDEQTKRKVLRHSSARQAVLLSDRTLVVKRGDPEGRVSVIKSPRPEDLALLLDAVDGKRSVAEICDVLEDEFDAEGVVALVEALEGVIFEAVGGVQWPRSIGGQIGVIGTGKLAVQIAAKLAEFLGRQIPLLWRGDPAISDTDVIDIDLVTADQLRSRLRELDVAVAVYSDIPVTRAIELNRELLQTDTLCIHASADRDAIVVGPTTVPYRTPCFECGQIFTYFENHAANDAGTAFERITVPEIEAVHLAELLAKEAAELIAFELIGLLEGRPYPTLLTSLVRLEMSTGKNEHEILPTTNCGSCHGCNRGGIATGLPASKPAIVPLDRSRRLIPDRAGGVRSVKHKDAQRRVESAMAEVGLALKAHSYSQKIEARYPELIDVPFVAVDVDGEFRRDAAILIGRLVRSYGKGTTSEQAMCSGVFEFLERNLAVYHGEVEIVRAPYNEVRDHAIDMEYFTEGLLDVPDLGPRIPFDRDAVIDWCWAHCLRRNEPILVPAETMFISGLGGRRRPLCRFRGGHLEIPWRGTSGISAGACREDAVLQGLYEILEGDGRNLQNRSGINAPAIELESIADPKTRPLLDRVRSAGFTINLRDLSRDIGIPVIEAYITSSRDLTFFRVPGYGCHHDPAIAIRRAVTEAVHTLGIAGRRGSQTFRDGAYSICNSFHDSIYCVGRISETVSFDDLPQPDPGWTTITDYLDAAIGSVVKVLPRADLCFFDHPIGGLEGVAVVGVFATGVYDATFDSVILPERLVALLPSGGRGEPHVALSELFLGHLKS